MNKQLLVSICCITYNHASFIRQCLDGMLKQQVNFLYEIIINDDCSNDGTSDIIREYAKRYPSIIKPIFHKDNQYKKGVRNIFEKFVFPKAKAKYISLCEGDDFWTDCRKLQKQVDFLEAHPESSLCFHNAIVHYQDGKLDNHEFSEIQEREYTRKELLKSWIAPTASFVFNRKVLSSTIYEKVANSNRLEYRDLPILLSASYCGKIYGIPEVMSVYRIHSGGAMQTHSSIPLKLCFHQIECRKIFKDDLKSIFNDKIGRNASIAISLFRHKKYTMGIKLWFVAFVYAPMDALKWSVKYFTNFLKRK